MKVRVLIETFEEGGTNYRHILKEFDLAGIAPKQANSAERVVVYSHAKGATKQGSFKELFRFNLIEKPL